MPCARGQKKPIGNLAHTRDPWELLMAHARLLSTSAPGVARRGMSNTRREHMAQRQMPSHFTVSLRILPQGASGSPPGPYLLDILISWFPFFLFGEIHLSSSGASKVI